MTTCPGSLTEKYSRTTYTAGQYFECDYCAMVFRRIEMKGPPNASDLVLPNHGGTDTPPEAETLPNSA